MRFIKQQSTIPGLKHIDWGMYYIGREQVRVILGPCLSILCASEQAKVIGVSHIYPSPFKDDRFGPFNHPENIVSAYLQEFRRLRVQDAQFWVTDREATTIRGKELIMRAIDAVVQTGHEPILLSGFPARSALTSNPSQMLVEVYDISSHDHLIK